MTDASDQQAVEQRYRMLWVIWFSMSVSIVMFFVVSRQIYRGATGEGIPLLLFVLAALGATTLSLSFAVKRLLITRAVDQQSIGAVQQAYVVAWSLCDVTCILGLMLYLTNGVPYYVVFFLAGALGMLLHIPRRVHLIDASFSGKGAVQ